MWKIDAPYKNRDGNFKEELKRNARNEKKKWHPVKFSVEIPRMQ